MMSLYQSDLVREEGSIDSLNALLCKGMAVWERSYRLGTYPGDGSSFLFQLSLVEYI